jgi:hypothetical protein
LRTKAIFGVVNVVLLAALIGCGGGSSSDNGASKSDKESSSTNSTEVKKLIRQTFGANPNATSGKLSGTVEIVVKGVPRYRQPISVTMSGPFNKPSGKAPEANLSVGLQLRNGALGGELILIGNQALIGLGSTAYLIPDSIAATIRRPLANSNNGLASVLAVFGIAPQRWVKDPRVVGNETVNGEETIHGSAEIDAGPFFLAVARLTKVLTSLRITEVTGLPREIDRNARVALTRSVTKATGDVYTGAKDHVLRKAMFDMALKPSAKDRKTLGGITSMTIKGQLDVTEIGSPQKIEPPSTRGSYDELQITLDALAESVR